MAVRYDATADLHSRTTNLPAITAFTLMGWFRIVTDRNAVTAFLTLGNTSGAAFASLQTAADGTTLNLYDGSTDHNGSALTVGTWYHLAMTCNGTSLTAYKDAVSDATGTRASMSSQTMFFGNDNTSEFLNGRAAAIKVYDAVLTAAEIKTERCQYVPVRRANLNSFYPMLSIANDETDFSPNNRTLTVGGTLATEEGPPIPWKAFRNAQQMPYIVVAATGQRPMPLRISQNFDVYRQQYADL